MLAPGTQTLARGRHAAESALADCGSPWGPQCQARCKGFTRVAFGALEFTHAEPCLGSPGCVPADEPAIAEAVHALDRLVETLAGSLVLSTFSQAEAEDC